MNKLEELINQYSYQNEGVYTLLDIRKLCVEYAKICLEKAAEEAVVFLPSHYGLHGTHNVDKQSITKIKLP